MAYALFFKLPPKHALNRTGEESKGWRDESMLSSIFKCEAEGRPFETFMKAALNEQTGKFDVSVTVRPQWSLRHLFAKRPVTTDVVKSDVTAEEAAGYLSKYDERGFAARMPVKEGVNQILNHFANLQEVREIIEPVAPKFASAREALDKLKPR